MPSAPRRPTAAQQLAAAAAATRKAIAAQRTEAHGGPPQPNRPGTPLPAGDVNRFFQHPLPAESDR